MENIEIIVKTREKSFRQFLVAPCYFLVLLQDLGTLQVRFYFIQLCRYSCCCYIWTQIFIFQITYFQSNHIYTSLQLNIRLSGNQMMCIHLVALNVYIYLNASVTVLPLFSHAETLSNPKPSNLIVNLINIVEKTVNKPYVMISQRTDRKRRAESGERRAESGERRAENGERRAESPLSVMSSAILNCQAD